jgi:adenylosuccinate synthase
VLSGLKEIKLCVAYRLADGTITEDYPVDTEVMSGATAIYETMPGWQDSINKARTWDALPPDTQAYCQRLAELLGVPIDFIGVGAERNDLIALRWPI